MLHTLFALDSRTALERHPKCGASWEGFIIEQLLTLLDVPEERVYFWRAHTGAELDLLVDRGDHRVGYEIKRVFAAEIAQRLLAANRAEEALEILQEADHATDSGPHLRREWSDARIAVLDALGRSAEAQANRRPRVVVLSMASHEARAAVGFR